MCLVHIFEIFLAWFVYLVMIWIRDKSHSGHSLTVGESVAVYSSELDGATAYEVSGIKLSLAFAVEDIKSIVYFVMEVTIFCSYYTAHAVI